MDSELLPGGAPTSGSAAVSPVAVDPAVGACFARNTPAPADLLVRVKGPELAWISHLLGGGYAYSSTSHECQDAVTYLKAITSSDPGHCIEIALAASNPGYKVQDKPAPPLREVIGAKGTCD